MDTVRGVLATIVYLYLLVLIVRLVFDWILVFSRRFTPKGPVLVLAETVYTLTDPPLKALRKVIPPLKLGQVRLDLAFLVLMLAVSLLLRVLR